MKQTPKATNPGAKSLTSGQWVIHNNRDEEAAYPSGHRIMTRPSFKICWVACFSGQGLDLNSKLETWSLEEWTMGRGDGSKFLLETSRRRVLNEPTPNVKLNALIIFNGLDAGSCSKLR